MGPVVLQRVWYTKDKPFILISVTQIIKKGFPLHNNNDKVIYLKKGNQQLPFFIIVCTNKGKYCFIYIKWSGPGIIDEAAFVTIDYNISRAHNLLCHMHEHMMHKVAKHLGWNILWGTLKPCKYCAIGKTWQRNLELHHSEPD